MNSERIYKEFYKQLCKDMMHGKVPSDPMLKHLGWMGFYPLHGLGRRRGFWGPFFGVIAGLWVYQTFSEHHAKNQELKQRFINKFEEL